MYRAKIEVFGSQPGELLLWDEDEQTLEYKIQFYKWIIEQYGHSCVVTRYVD